MPKKVDIMWKNGEGWTWLATRYEGNGIFYGKVTSPFVPEGEYGTWYLWEIEEDGGAILFKGDEKFLNEIKRKSAAAMDIQRAMMGRAKKNLQEKVV
jgi:hypothetical protein